MKSAGQVTAWTLEGAEGQTILGDTHLPDRDAIGAMLICHGFKGYKDYGFFPRLAHEAAKRGLVAHRFNFSHSGMTNRTATFERPDLFERDTWGKQVEDLTRVARATADGALPGGSQRRFVFFGQSRGGVTAILTAARLFDRNDPLAPVRLISAAAPHLACNLDDDQRAALRRRGFLESPSSRTGQVLRVGRAWLDEIERDPAAVDPVAAIARVRCPVLVIQGDADDAVPIQAAFTLAQAAGDRVKFQVIRGGTHTFNAPNPLPLDAPLASQTQTFLDTVCTFATTE